MSNNLKSGQFLHLVNEVVGRVPKDRSKSRPPKVITLDRMSNVFGGFVMFEGSNSYIGTAISTIASSLDFVLNSI